MMQKPVSSEKPGVQPTSKNFPKKKKSLSAKVKYGFHRQRHSSRSSLQQGEGRPTAVARNAGDRTSGDIATVHDSGNTMIVEAGNCDKAELSNKEDGGICSERSKSTARIRRCHGS
ncbi:hypothetical protein Ancab_004264 [Ancistrocladus abbreviatus]